MFLLSLATRLSFCLWSPYFSFYFISYSPPPCLLSVTFSSLPVGFSFLLGFPFRLHLPSSFVHLVFLYYFFSPASNLPLPLFLCFLKLLFTLFLYLPSLFPLLNLIFTSSNLLFSSFHLFLLFLFFLFRFYLAPSLHFSLFWPTVKTVSGKVGLPNSMK